MEAQSTAGGQNRRSKVGRHTDTRGGEGERHANTHTYTHKQQGERAHNPYRQQGKGKPHRHTHTRGVDWVGFAAGVKVFEDSRDLITVQL